LARISEDPQQGDCKPVKERDHSVTEKVVRVDGGLGSVAVNKSYGLIGVNDGLLIDAANPF